MPSNQVSAQTGGKVTGQRSSSGDTSRLTLLYEVAEHVNSTLDIDQCLDRIIDGAYRIFQAEKVSLMLIDEDTNEMRIRAARNVPDQVVADTRVVPGEGLSGKVALSGEPLVVSDLEGDPRFQRKSKSQYRTGSFAIVPLMHKDDVLGVINLTNRSDDISFSENDLALLTALANQAAIAIQNSRLVSELSREKEQLKRSAFESNILYQVSSSLRYGLGYQHLIKLLGSSLEKLLDYDVFCSLLILRGREDFETRVLHDVPEGYVVEVKRCLVDCLAARPHGAAVSERLETLRRGLPPADGPSPQSIVAVPLEVGSQAMGMICLTSRRQNAFSADDTALLHTIVRKMGQTVERLQNTIRGEQDKMQSMVASMSEGVVMFDANDELGVLNRAARSMLGLAASEEFTTESFLKSVMWREIGLFLAEPMEGTGAVREFSADGEPTPRALAVAVSPVKNARGEHLGRLGIIRDVTRERELDRMKSDFVAVVSHELRTPLASVKMFSSNLLDGVEGELTEGQRETLTRMMNNLDRLSRLINDLLDLSKLEAGKMEMKLAPLDLRQMLDSAVQVFVPVARPRRVEINLRVPDHLPVLWADPDLIERVLTNLLGNALKFTPEGGYITVEAKRRPPDPAQQVGAPGERSPVSGEGYVLVSVTDTGPGIPEQDLEHVFDKFYQVDHSMTRRTGGTGLGLPICEEIITKHGGRIWADNTPDEGAAFSFELPVDCREHDKPQLYAAMEREIRRSRRYGVRFSVLMPDIDDFTVLNQKYGYENGDTTLLQLEELVKEEVKKFLKERIRETDVVGRFGGDELLIIAPETDEEGARAFAERLRSLVEEHKFLVKDKAIKTTVSVGLGSFREEDLAPTSLIRRSAAALGRAKDSGKNKVC